MTKNEIINKQGVLSIRNSSVDQWYSEHYIRFYQEIVVPTNNRKDSALLKRKKSEIIKPPPEIIEKHPEY